MVPKLERWGPDLVHRSPGLSVPEGLKLRHDPGIRFPIRRLHHADPGPDGTRPGGMGRRAELGRTRKRPVRDVVTDKQSVRTSAGTGSHSELFADCRANVTSRERNGKLLIRQGFTRRPATR